MVEIVQEREDLMTRLAEILRHSKIDEWTGDIPEVPNSLRIAADSLCRKEGVVWDCSEDELSALLATNSGISELFNRFDATTIGFAIRAVRLSRAKR